MKKLKISRTDFDLAFELSHDGSTTYLDSETGEVIWIERDIPRKLEALLTDEETLEQIEATLQAQLDLTDIDRLQLLDAAKIEEDFYNNRYLVIPKQDSHIAYQEMDEFIRTIQEQRLHERLGGAIRNFKPFRRFKDMLSHYPNAQKDWFQFSDQQREQRILDWLSSEEIEPDFI